jgi:hypothetical protein
MVKQNHCEITANKPIKEMKSIVGKDTHSDGNHSVTVIVSPQS